MKTVKLTAIFAVVGLAFLFAACSETESINESLVAAEKSADMGALLGDSCTYDGVLTDDERIGLQLMREEEKLARDVYLYFYEMYGAGIFQNIAKSETAHMNALLHLIEGYGLEDPALALDGEFANQYFTDLYTSLIEQGSDSLVAALKVGATIEDLDIYDLQKLLAETENADVNRVYENLLKGSENHMRAFIKMLDNMEASYTPQFISTEEFEAILAAVNIKGKGSKGQNRGNSNSNSKGNKGNANSGSGDCDGTGTANGNQSGSADGTQNGSTSGNLNGNQTGNANTNGAGNSNGNQGANGNGNSNGKG